MRPSCIGNYLDLLDDDTATYPGSDELLSIGSAVGKKLGLIKIGIHIETLLPGRRTSWPHAESSEEEFGFVIDGNPEVWLDGEVFPLKPGDFVAFPSGTGMAHTFINNTRSPVRLLVGGEARKNENQIIYPLHPQRNLEMKEKGWYWDTAPARKAGPHDGKPDLLRSGERSPAWSLPVLRTERLLLRPLELSDARAMYDYASVPEVARYTSWFPHEQLEDSLALIRFMHGNYLQQIPDALGVCLKESPETLIGTVGAFWGHLRAHKTLELGYVLGNKFWGKGLVHEALEAFIPYLWKNYEVNRSQARCIKENAPSRRVLEKLGMVREGLLRSSFMAKGKCFDLEIFSLTGQ